MESQSFFLKIKSKILSFFKMQSDENHVKEIHIQEPQTVDVQERDEKSPEKSVGERWWDIRREQFISTLQLNNWPEEEINIAAAREFPKYEPISEWDIETNKMLETVRVTVERGIRDAKKLDKDLRVIELKSDGFSKRKIKKIIEKEFGNTADETFIRRSA